MFLRSILIALSALALMPQAARAADSLENCTGYIDAVPATVSTPGVWCLRKELLSNVGMATAITVAGPGVTVDCNGFRVWSNAEGYYGIYATNQADVTVRNCSIFGFRIGISLDGTGGRFLVERNRVHTASLMGIKVNGNASMVRGNTVTKVGNSSNSSAWGISANGNTDVIDNAVNGVVSQQTPWGIQSINNIGGRVSGNRVRGVLSATGMEVRAIHAEGRVLISDNDIMFTGTQAGAKRALWCSTATSRARNNIVSGTISAMYKCGDAGGNNIAL